MKKQKGFAISSMLVACLLSAAFTTAVVTGAGNCDEPASQCHSDN